MRSPSIRPTVLSATALALLMVALTPLIVPRAGTAEASPAYPVIQVLVQPDGASFTARLWGDEFANGWETANTGHTVIRHPSRRSWVYAVRDLQGRLTASEAVVGVDIPPVAPRLRPSRAYVNSVRAGRSAPSLGEPTALAAPPWAGTGTRVLFIMVQFTDTACTFTPAQMQANMFGNTATGPGNLADYYFEISYGHLGLQGTVVGNAAGTGCVALANNRNHYDEGPGSDDTLVAEAVGLVDGQVNFADFDNDGNGVVDALGIIYAGGGPHDGCDATYVATDNNNLWPHSGSTGGTATADGVTVNPFIINSERTRRAGTNGVAACTQIQTIGLFAHEFGHSLGLPDLYDTDNSSAGVGPWSTMASQYSSTLNLADTPAHFDPWSKWFLGWITPTDYTGQNVGVNLDQAADSGMVARFLANPNGAEIGGTGEYFLVENRQRVRFDAQLPGCGVLIWHIDEARNNNTQEGHTAAMHRLVDIERADNSFPFIDGSGNLVDNIDTAGIPYPGTSNNNVFADTTTPTARTYDGSASGVRIVVPGNGTAACAASMPVNFGLPFAELSIAKTASPNPVVAGEQLDYTISVTNNGPGSATDVVVTDVLPAGVTYLANSDSCVNNSGTLTCSLGTLMPNVVATFTIQVRVNANLLSSIPGSTTNISNTASVAATEPDGNLSNNSVTITTNVIESADVSVRKECKPDTGPAPAGTSGVCSIFVTNFGPSFARLVTLTDTHFSNGTFSIGTPVTTQGTCSVGGAGTVVSCNLGTIGSGQTVQIDVPITSDNGVDVNNVARALSATQDPDTTNNEATSGLSFAASADLVIVKTGPASVNLGATFSYTLSVDNNGPSTANNVVVTDALPPGVQFVSAVASVGTFNVVGSTVSWNLGTVAVADPVRTLQVTVRVLPTTGATLVNNASVTSSTADPNGANNLSTTTTQVIGTDLWIAKSGTAPANNPSGALVYQITVYNSAGNAPDDTPTSGSGGPNAAQNVQVVDVLPLDNKKMVVQFLTPGCTYSSSLHRVACSVATLPAGASATFEIQVQIKGSVGLITNTATVTSETYDPNTSNNTDIVNNVIKGGTRR